MRVLVFPETPFPIDRILAPILQDLERLSAIPFSYLNGTELIENSPNIPADLNLYDACVQLLVDKKADLCPYPLTVTKNRLEKVDFLVPYFLYSRKIAFILGKTGFDYDAVDYFALLRVFDWGLWVGVVSSIVLFPVVCWMVGKDEGYWGYWEQVFGLVVMQGREVKAKRRYFFGI